MHKTVVKKDSAEKAADKRDTQSSCSAKINWQVKVIHG